MLLTVCVAKIHRATVTDANLNYQGSITIDKNILDTLGLFPSQIVQITNLSNGVLWRTYILAGPAGKGDICLNGPPARHFHKGDKVVILAEAWVTPEEAAKVHTKVAFVNDKNQIIKTTNKEKRSKTQHIL